MKCPFAVNPKTPYSISNLWPYSSSEVKAKRNVVEKFIMILIS